MNLIEFFRGDYTLKVEVLLTDPDNKRVCLTIVQTAPDTRKALRTNQFYLKLSEARILFQDFLSCEFWVANRRYPKRQFRRIRKSSRYRDVIIQPKDNDLSLSIIDGEKENVLRFQLTSFEAAEMADTVLDYLDKKRLAWAIKQAIK